MQPIGNNRTIIDVEGTAYVSPKRSWLVPLSLLLPYSIGIRATIRLGVTGLLETGRVSTLCTIICSCYVRCNGSCCDVV
jgi:hypothetical protein